MSALEQEVYIFSVSRLYDDATRENIQVTIDTDDIGTLHLTHPFLREKFNSFLKSAGFVFDDDSI